MAIKSIQPTLLLWAILTLLVVPSANADPVPATASATREQLEAEVLMLRSETARLDALLAQAEASISTMKGKLEGLDGTLYAQYIETKKREYIFHTKIMEMNERIYDAQLISSYVVLTLVGLVVLAGVCFSGFQLINALSVAGVQPSNDLEVSAGKVRITSSVVGIIVLVISIVFLYIYISQVYHIKSIDPYAANVPNPKDETKKQSP